MIGWRSLLLVARRDFLERVKSRAFQISTALTIVLVLAAVVAPQFLTRDPAEWHVAVVGADAATIAASIEVLQGSSEPVPVRTVAAPSRAAAVALLEAGDVDVAAIAGEGVVTAGSSVGSLVQLTAAALRAQEFADRVAGLELRPDQVAELFGGGVMDITAVDSAAEAGPGGEALALFTTILLFVSIVTYGQWILVGVIEEKSNRVVEVVLGTVPPRLLLSGKVIGIGLLGLLQLIAIGVVAFSALGVMGTVDLPETTGAAVAATAFWFLLGFAFYATAYAAAGSLVSRQEEAQNAAFPLTLVLMAAYFVATFSIGGDNPVIRAASLLPPFAPMTMPLRIALGRATGWEIAVSAGLMLGGVYVLMRLASRIYRGGILRAGRRMRLNEAWRSAQG